MSPLFLIGIFHTKPVEKVGNLNFLCIMVHFHNRSQLAVV